ncbi:MAG: extracellular solute-binding protein, partial [Chloroflexales bacterium]|nr:extracellular solute-binding protein [Chloroflexales bacterium]
APQHLPLRCNITAYEGVWMDEPLAPLAGVRRPSFFSATRGDRRQRCHLMKTVSSSPLFDREANSMHRPFRTTHTWVALILFVVAIVAGCATPPLPNPAGESITISFITRRSRLEYHQQLAAAFHTEHPTITVEVIDLQQLHAAWGDHRTIASAEYSRRLVERADVVPIGSYYEGVNLYDGIRLNLLTDLQPLLDQDATSLRDLFIPQTLAAFGWQDGLYGLPWFFQVPLMVYNPQLFDTAGRPYPAEHWTWDDFLAVAQHFSNLSAKQFGFLDIESGPALMPFALVTQNKAEVIRAADRLPELNLDDPAIIQALEWYLDLSKVHQVTQPVSAHTGMTDAICQGQVALWHLDILFNPTIRSDPDDPCVSGTAATWPQGDLAAPPMLVHGFGISAGTSQPQAAWQWLTFVSRRQSDPQFLEWSALQVDLDKDSLAAERRITQQAVDTIRATVAAAVPRQLEYDALQPVLKALPQAYDDPTALRQTIQELAAAPAPTTAPAPIAVATPAPPTSVAQTTIGFVPPTRFGRVEDITAYEALAAEFRKQNPDIQVEVRTFPDFMTADAIAKQADVFLGTERVAFESVAANHYRTLVLDLQPLIDADPTFAAADLPQVRFTYPPGSSAAGIAGVPVSFDSMGMLYNQEQFATAGAPTPAPDWTWNDFGLTMGSLTAGAGDAKQYGYVSSGDALDLELFLAGRGITLPEQRLGDPNQASSNHYAQESELRAALAWWFAFQQDGPMAPVALPRPELLEQRRGAMWADFLGDVGRSANPLYLRAQAEGWELGFAPMPQGAAAAVALRWNIAYIAAQTQAREASWRWVRFLSDHPVGTLAPARQSLLRAEAFPSQVGAEMQQVYLQALDAYAQGGTAISHETLGSPFLQTILQAVREGSAVDLAIDQALQNP